MHSRRRAMCGRGNPIGMPGATPSEWEPPPKVDQINGRGVRRKNHEHDAVRP
jgi:hypothetical protein